MKFFVTFTLLALAIQTSSSATMEEYVTTQEYGELLEKVDQLRKLVETMRREETQKYESLLEKFEQSLLVKFEHSLLVKFEHLLLEKFNHSLTEECGQLRKLLESKKEEHCRPAPSEICGNCIRRDDSRLPTKYVCDCRSLAPKRDCLEHFHNGGKVSGLYVVHQDTNVEVYCDQQTDGGGWTVFQRRKDGSVNFNRNWGVFKKGFGDPSNEYWLGNDLIHMMTIPESELRIEMEDWDNKAYFEKYGTFQVGDEQTKYMLDVSEPSGSAGDGGKGLMWHNRMGFSTPDNDNEKRCAKDRKGGWWYNYCTYVHLNGYFYLKNENENRVVLGEQIEWEQIPSKRLKFVEMKMRRKQ